MSEDSITFIETVNYGLDVQCKREYENGILRMETWC